MNKFVEFFNATVKAIILLPVLVFMVAALFWAYGGLAAIALWLWS